MADQEKLLEAATDFKAKVDRYRGAHFRASDHLRIIHYILGTLLIIVSAIVSGSILQSTATNPSHALTLTTGILSIVVVVLTAVQTTFKLGERGELHRSAASGFGATSTKLEIFIDRDHHDLAKAWDELQAIADEISQVEKGAPGYLRHTYEQAAEEVNRGLQRPLAHA
jgi:hypothetical protein